MARTAEWQLWDREGVADWIEDYWHANLREQVHRDQLMDLCAPYLPSRDLDVLEVGCGTGLIYQRLTQSLVPNERYTGVDISEQMLAHARRKFPAGRFHQASGYELPFADRELDVVLSFEVVGHLPEVGPFLRELVRVARQRTVFTVWPAQDGPLRDGRATILGNAFLHREYSHEYLMAEMRSHLGDQPLDLEVAILSAECWAYILHRRQGPPGIALKRLYPIYGLAGRLVEAIARAQSEK
ncbi:MAG TPA: class I SAM-dependent methyltransferase [Thermoanaerobaculia bacterium]|nr:class I SAM-dependent methyltransferase [Thermoanaerobaculia bacterium]